MITEFPTQAATVVALLAFDSEGLEFDWRHEVLNKAHRSKKQAAWKHKLPLQPTGVSLENRPTAFIDTALTPSAHGKVTHSENDSDDPDRPDHTPCVWNIRRSGCLLIRLSECLTRKKRVNACNECTAHGRRSPILHARIDSIAEISLFCLGAGGRSNPKLMT